MFDVEAEKASVKELIMESVEAENRRDVEASLKVYDKDVYVLAPGMKLIRGHDEFRTLYNAILGSLVSNENWAIDIQFSEKGDMCYFVAGYKMVLKGSEGNHDEIGKYLAVLRKKSGEWKIEAISYSADK